MENNIKIYTLDKSTIDVFEQGIKNLRKPILITKTGFFGEKVNNMKDTELTYIIRDAEQGYNMKKFGFFGPVIKSQPIKEGAYVYLCLWGYDEKTIKPLDLERYEFEFPKVISLDELSREEYERYENEFDETLFKPYNNKREGITSRHQEDRNILQEKINESKREEFRELELLEKREPYLEDFLEEKLDIKEIVKNSVEDLEVVNPQIL